MAKKGVRKFALHCTVCDGFIIWLKHTLCRFVMLAAVDWLVHLAYVFVVKIKRRRERKERSSLKAISHYVFYKYIDKLALNALSVRLSIRCEICHVTWFRSFPLQDRVWVSLLSTNIRLNSCLWNLFILMQLYILLLIFTSPHWMHCTNCRYYIHLWCVLWLHGISRVWVQNVITSFSIFAQVFQDDHCWLSVRWIERISQWENVRLINWNPVENYRKKILSEKSWFHITEDHLSNLNIENRMELIVRGKTTKHREILSFIAETKKNDA